MTILPRELLYYFSGLAPLCLFVSNSGIVAVCFYCDWLWTDIGGQWGAGHGRYQSKLCVIFNFHAIFCRFVPRSPQADWVQNHFYFNNAINTFL